jgi:hypothetical protein
MVGSSGAARRHVDFARIGLGISDEFGNGFSRQRWIYNHDVEHAHDAGDRRNVADEIEVKFPRSMRAIRARRFTRTMTGFFDIVGIPL